LTSCRMPATRSTFLSALRVTSGASTGSSGKQTATKSKAASEFIGAQPTRYEFGVRPALKNQYGSYENYIKTKMSQNKNLTDEDIYILSQHYGLS